ncbi:type IV pilus modification PilV family protein [Aureibacillus halotolerans]|uniref:Type II secretory pathway pseudopilin PulG n=1 Tax=Aureibacillus halotolerans TaxID=1508390 RepID=A0A4R6U1J2_9BACI|nr:type II secretion system protein [Aureibacillus halotolerans]TDQ38289.1 type II secretory pathway pseudopilin PulG [Aureibacillus halotolerans]
MHKSEEGFTLIEVLLATALLVGTGFLLFSLLGNGVSLVKKNEDRMEAVHLAQSELEAIRAKRDLVLYGEQRDFPAETIEACQTPKSSVDKEYVIRICTSQLNERLTKVRVSIEPHDIKTSLSQRVVEFETVLLTALPEEGGLQDAS